MKKRETSVVVANIPHRYGNSHVPYGITQCYLSPGRGDLLPSPQPIKAGTRFSDPGGMQSCVDLVDVITY